MSKKYDWPSNMKDAFEPTLPLQQELENEILSAKEQQITKILIFENVEQVFSTYLICLMFATIIFSIEIIYIVGKIKFHYQKSIKSINKHFDKNILEQS